MEIPSHKDIDGNNHFLLETSLSKEFFMEHTETMFIANSDDDKLNDFSFDSTPKYSGTCVEVSDEVKSSSSKKDILLGDDTSSSKIQVLIDSSSKKQSYDDSPCLQSELKVTISEESIIPFLLSWGIGKKLQHLLLAASTSTKVQEVPTTYNGLCVFELWPTFGKVSNMEGMQQKYDDQDLRNPIYMFQPMLS